MFNAEDYEDYYNEMAYSDYTILNSIFAGKYKPDKKIGEGSFGKIFSCVNIKEQKKYALKILRNNKYIIFYFLNIGIKRIS